MSDFIKQIEEDIKYYQADNPHITNMHKNEWAFNFWILDKLFFEDSELIEEKIVDYKDMAIDAYETYEDTKDVYLIQNKYYSDSTQLSADYVKNDFLIRGITALENGTYSRSQELQDFFTKYKNHDDFRVHLELFVTNNNRNIEADNYVRKFNTEHPRYQAKIYYLDDIEERYYGETKPIKKNITVQIESINKGTILNINSENYKLENVIDARYVFTPVVSIYRVYRDAIEKGYPIFDMNIREYLGNKGVNKNIYLTLLNADERKNFFYYNNGITIICDKMKKIETKSNPTNNIHAVFDIENPQIVNGCQTVNSIYEALRNVDPSNLESEFKDAFVMLKILEINRSDSKEDLLYKNIVKFNNSQNAIDEKTFVANTAQFLRLQNEFESRGFLLLIKQSDKNSYSVKYKVSTELKKLNSERLIRFGLPEMTNLSDVHIPLEKLFQIINAFCVGGEVAYKNKSNMLKYGSKEYNRAVSFIKSTTTDQLLDLYLLYRRAEKAKKEEKEARYPIPYYLIDGFSLNECHGRKSEEIIESLNDNGKVEYIIKLYKAVTKAYTKEFFSKNEIEYNKMIKRPVDYEMFNKNRDVLSGAIE